MGMYMSGVASRTWGSWARKEFWFLFWTRLMDSMPPAMTVSMPSTMICLAAAETAMSPDEHWRSMDWPETLTGRPAAMATWRPTLNPCVPCWRAEPTMTSSTSAGSIPARETTASMAGAAMVGAGVSLKAPR